MEIATDVSASSQRLAQAILLYKSSHAHSGRSEVKFASVHEVSLDEKGAAFIEAGVPLTQEALHNTIMQIGRGNDVRTWRFVEPSVIASGPSIVAWWTPASVHHVFFRESTGIPSGPAAQPAMLWVRSRKHGLYVYALASGERPTLKTEVFNSPHYNVWASNRVCTGSMMGSALEDYAGCMEAFWRSEFSHRNDVGSWKQTLFKGGLKKLWLKLLKDKGQNPFPVDALEPSKLTVEQVLNEIGGVDV